MSRIVDVRTHVLEAGLDQPFAWSFDSASKRSSCLVEIETEDGTIGWGECFGPARLNAAVVGAFRMHLIGADSMATDLIWQTLYNKFRDQGQKGLVVTAISGVDIALWDIKGKRLGLPVHQLLGGPLRKDLPAYATGTYRTREGDPLEYVVREMVGYRDEGFTAGKIKIGFDVAGDAALIRRVREAVGPDFGLMLDANHGYDAIEAVQLGRTVADLNIGWFEEPVVPDDLDSYRDVKAGQPIPVAGGECEFTRWGFRNVLVGRAMDIIQPDTCATGGISEAKKIADMATAFGIRYVPHVWGTGIGLAAALQLLAVIPDSPPRHRSREPWLEFDRSEHPFRQAVLVEPIVHVDGRVAVPHAPGLGIEIDRDAVRRFAVGA